MCSANFGIFCILLLVQVANAGHLTLDESAITKVAGKGTKLADEVPFHKLSTEFSSGEGVTDPVNFVKINSSRFLAKCKEMEVNAPAKARWDRGDSEVSQCLERDLTTGVPDELALSAFARGGK